MASPDIGLNSGNAVVDRASVPGQTILIYQTVGTSTFTAPNGVTSVRVLTIGGGGAGGSTYAGGGGGGEVIHSTSEAVTAGTPLSVSIGAGGTPCPAEVFGCGGGGGQDSSFGSLIIARGGGGGGGGNSNPGNIAPTSGGSGGGGGGFGSDAEAQGAPAGTAGTTGTNGVSNRNAGGNSGGVAVATTKTGGGGGGASATGDAGTISGGGKGGDGVLIDITGTNTRYGGGGGGGSNVSPDQSTNTGGSGGLGGGGTGGWDTGATDLTGTTSNGQAGTANTGGGGGGSSQVSIDAIQTLGGAGGSGVVIIRFATVDYDIDNDGISSDVENAAPNNGDGNNDGTADSGQTYVASFVNPITSTYAVLQVNSACTINTVGSSAESANNVTDSGFNYPAGLMSLTLNCGTPGYTTTVTQYYYGVTSSSFVLRKYNPNINAYFTISGATLTQTTIGGQTATRVTYQATDGGELDTDGTANGTIVDPVGLAQSAVSAPNTGLGGRQ